jgi:cell wall-associated NlpC family hydrolase
MASPSDVLGSWPVQLGLVVVMAVGGCWLFELALRAFTGTLRMPRRRPPRRGRRPRARGSVRAAVRAPRRPAAPVRRPLEAVAADLRRLGRELALVSTGSAAHRAGVQAAYDDVLVEAAATLEVPHRLTGTGPGEERELERLRLLVALGDAGLVVGGAGPRG